MKVVITGGSGFIGRALLERMSRSMLAAECRKGRLGADMEVHVLGSSDRSVELLRLAYPVFNIGGPWPSGGPDVSAALDNADVLLHMAWSTMPSTAAADPGRDRRENIATGRELLDNAACAGVRAVIFLSSGGTVYGNAQVLPISEEHSTAPVTQYGLTKLEFEELLGKHAVEHGYRALVLRPGNVYGNTQMEGRPQGVVEHWLTRALAEEPMEAWNDLSMVRDYVYIDDMVDVLVACIQRPGLAGTYNVGTGIGTTLSELVALIEQVSGKPAQVSSRPVPVGAVAANVLDSTSLSTLLGFAPRTRLAEGLRSLMRKIARV